MKRISEGGKKKLWQHVAIMVGSPSKVMRATGAKIKVKHETLSCIGEHLGKRDEEKNHKEN